eukprot:gnl/MRDRNA2_/MRDRNA2_57667_c0_seq1.p1 gnl/MRDRNA2_/MRDRNA2_57667_c0~~gnl/MRDRNA2_/MRDRNA2_57667_c0_seq1.p1  ORF type:complete len:316 (+),score=58.13 gnl/MRDRNA2_/MRDRNA2_57667_c0_seq1:101-1048(+)
MRRRILNLFLSLVVCAHCIPASDNADAATEPLNLMARFNSGVYRTTKNFAQYSDKCYVASVYFPCQPGYTDWCCSERWWCAENAGRHVGCREYGYYLVSACCPDYIIPGDRFKNATLRPGYEIEVARREEEAKKIRNKFRVRIFQNIAEKEKAEKAGLIGKGRTRNRSPHRKEEDNRSPISSNVEALPKAESVSAQGVGDNSKAPNAKEEDVHEPKDQDNVEEIQGEIARLKEELKAEDMHVSSEDEAGDIGSVNDKSQQKKEEEPSPENEEDIRPPPEFSIGQCLPLLIAFMTMAGYVKWRGRQRMTLIPPLVA